MHTGFPVVSPPPLVSLPWATRSGLPVLALYRLLMIALRSPLLQAARKCIIRQQLMDALRSLLLQAARKC